MGKIRVGSAIFRHTGTEELNGRQVNVITFQTRLARFTDAEKIYSDPESFLPLRVERQISTWPFPERITEEYDQEKFTLTIRKHKFGRQETAVVKKGDVIHNAILLPYYVRDAVALAVGHTVMARLPTQEFTIELVSREEVELESGKCTAYRFESKPKRFQIWISADERRIPVKIKGTGALGYVLIMDEYRLN